MGVETRTWYVCDGCGRRSENENFDDGNTHGRGEMNLWWNRGGRGHDGSIGGISGDDDYLLCYKCTGKVQEFIGSLKK